LGPCRSGFVPNLQCTSCDLQVLRVDSHVWGDGVSCMFLRNDYPNVMKLRKHLKAKKDCSAYCCQCTSRSADSAAELAAVAEGIRWRGIEA